MWGYTQLYIFSMCLHASPCTNEISTGNSICSSFDFSNLFLKFKIANPRTFPLVSTRSQISFPTSLKNPFFEGTEVISRKSPSSSKIYSFFPYRCTFLNLVRIECGYYGSARVSLILSSCPLISGLTKMCSNLFSVKLTDFPNTSIITSKRSPRS